MHLNLIKKKVINFDKLGYENHIGRVFGLFFLMDLRLQQKKNEIKKKIQNKTIEVVASLTITPIAKQMYDVSKGQLPCMHYTSLHFFQFKNQGFSI